MSNNRSVTKRQVAKVFETDDATSAKKISRSDYVCNAILFLSDRGIDENRLLDKLGKYSYSVKPVTSVRGALEQLECIYNNRTSSKNKDFFMSDFDKYMSQKKTLEE